MRFSAATLAGLGAVALWSTLALFTAMTGAVPAFQLVAMTFLIGGGLILGLAAARGRLSRARPTLGSFALGLIGLFGDTAFYFAAVKLAPPAEANLVHYLWPLLIVLFATLLPGGSLKLRHLIGALIGLAAVALLIVGRIDGPTPAPDRTLGLSLAASGAVVWAGYSVLSRRFADVATESVGVTLMAAACLALACHITFETTVWPASMLVWAGVIGLGVGPVGAAFVLWDVGMKRGDVSFLGVASYAAPVLSTLTLVVVGYAPATGALAVACIMIVAGAAIASFSTERPDQASAESASDSVS